MPFRYRLEKVLDFRIRKKEEQLQAVLKAQLEVYRIEELIQKNNIEIATTRKNMSQSDPMMYESYDKFLKHLYVKGEQLEEEKKQAEQKLEEEKLKLIECEKDVKVLEKHKEKMKEIYIAEEKAAELKQFSEIGVQKFFQKVSLSKEEEELLKQATKEDNE